MKNFLKTARRNLLKNKLFSVLNVAGLAAGLACFAFIALWVCDEVSYDKFNRNYDRIVRLVATVKTETGTEQTAASAAPMAKALQQDYAEVEKAVRLRMREEIITQNNQQVLQPGILLTDPSFFDVFSYPLTKGDPATALREPYSIVLTASSAKKYFGAEDPMGRTLLLNMYDSTGRGALYKITGVMPDPPANAHFTFTMLASFKTVEVTHPEVLTADGWGDASFYTYLLLKKGVDCKTFSGKITHFYGRYVGNLFSVWKPIYAYRLQPLRDVHLRSAMRDEIAPTGSMTRVYVFSIVGFFILLLAGINYTNLATARSARRAKEVGVKKVMGAGKRQLVLQYLSESVFTAVLALAISFLLLFSLQPVFSGLTGKDVSLFSSPLLLLFLFGVAVFLGVLSGIYPAFVLSAFNPAAVLKGSFASGSKGAALRKVLVVSQFAVTMLLITGIVIIYFQMAFIRQKDLGYNKEALLFIKANGNADVIKGYTAFKDELQGSPLISGMTTSNSLIVGGLGGGGAETVDAKGAPLQVNTARLRVDTDYLAVYGIRLLAGKNFIRHTPGDTLRQVIVNETAVKKFGWPSAEAALGQPFKMGDRKGTVVGVTNNFHFASLEQPIEPLAMYPLADHFSRITLKIDIGKTADALALIQKAWKKHFPAALFDYDFVSRQVKEQYRAEEQFSAVFFYFSLLSLLIACLGLYGLIAYTVIQKTKEIGIRKVLGATAGRIAVLLSVDFLKPVVLACLLSVPVAWFVMYKWLQDFAYRVSLSWWMFTLAGILVLSIALLTVSVQALKAAVTNPVKSLRTE